MDAMAWPLGSRTVPAAREPSSFFTFVGEALRFDFDRRMALLFRGSAVTPDPGQLACRELDDTLGLSITVASFAIV